MRATIFVYFLQYNQEKKRTNIRNLNKWSDTGASILRRLSERTVRNLGGKMTAEETEVVEVK
jgi:hypothetical protein